MSSSSCLRQDLVTGDWVVIASNRADRPNSLPKKLSFPIKKLSTDPSQCSFCQILQKEKPLLVFNHGHQLDCKKPIKNWTIAVVNNKYPAFTPQAESNGLQNHLYNTKKTSGYHELVITADHYRSPEKMTSEELEEIFQVYQKRYLFLSRQPGVKYVSIFHNQGQLAGASIQHPHSQIMAIPVTDADINSSLEGSQRFWQKNKACPHCLIIKDDLDNQQRLIWENQRIIVSAPFAPKSAFCLNIYPKIHQSDFGQADPATIADLAQAFHVSLKALAGSLDNPDYNFFLQTSPCDQKNYDYYHWHWQIMPKTQIWAGFELGAGIEISTISPEDVSQILKKEIKKLNY